METTSIITYETRNNRALNWRLRARRGAFPPENLYKWPRQHTVGPVNPLDYLIYVRTQRKGPKGNKR